MSSTKNKIFRFKQFEVDQTGCAMKINTDGTLLAVLSEKENARKILDIGTGTGVVALMLAQRYPSAHVDAVEIDPQAAHTAKTNFQNSVFANRLKLYPVSFQEFSEQYPHTTYDLIVSNPPFFINALKNPDVQKQTARHADTDFFAQLIAFARKHLSADGRLVLILPVDTAAITKKMAENAQFYLQQTVHIRSFANAETHRQLLCFSQEKKELDEMCFVIYSIQKEYSDQFVNKMKDFFTIF